VVITRGEGQYNEGWLVHKSVAVNEYLVKVKASHRLRVLDGSVVERLLGKSKNIVLLNRLIYII